MHSFARSTSTRLPEALRRFVKRGTTLGMTGLRCRDQFGSPIASSEGQCACGGISVCPFGSLHVFSACFQLAGVVCAATAGP